MLTKNICRYAARSMWPDPVWESRLKDLLIGRFPVENLNSGSTLHMSLQVWVVITVEYRFIYIH